MLHMVTPRSGLPALIVSLVLFLMLLNTFAILPDRRAVLRSLALVLGSAFVLKFVLLAALSETDGGRLKRVLIALADLATLGTISQDPIAPSAGYLAFAVCFLYLVGIAALPARHEAPPAGLVRVGDPDLPDLIVRP